MSIKSLLVAIGISVSGLALSGCVSEGYYGSGGGYYEPYYASGGYVGSAIVYDSGREYRRYPRYYRDYRYRDRGGRYYRDRDRGGRYYRDRDRHRSGYDRPGRPSRPDYNRPGRPRPPESRPPQQQPQPPQNSGRHLPAGARDIIRYNRGGQN